MVKNLPAMQETWVRPLRSGRSRGEGIGNPFRYSCLENPVDRGAWGGYSPWGHEESDTPERLTVEHLGGTSGSPVSAQTTLNPLTFCFRVGKGYPSSGNEAPNPRREFSQEQDRLPPPSPDRPTPPYPQPCHRGRSGCGNQLGVS